MATIDPYELEVLAAFESGSLKSVASKAELAKLKAAARATATKDKRVNIRLSSGDLQDIQAKALQEGMPYQTLIASILHKYVTGRLEERASAGAARSSVQHPPKGRASKTDA
jgi:predicted DNA binding CopG/RHH family protein